MKLANIIEQFIIQSRPIRVSADDGTDIIEQLPVDKAGPVAEFIRIMKAAKIKADSE
jgi:hypothetical protein